MHDPRLGRFFAVDPLTAKYPYYTPYQFSGNRVIDMVELEGLEPDEAGKTEGQIGNAFPKDDDDDPEELPSPKKTWVWQALWWRNTSRWF